MPPVNIVDRSTRHQRFRHNPRLHIFGPTPVLAIWVGSLAVALGTVFIALSANAFTRKRVLIDFTGLWIEEMRKTFASYVGALEALPHAEDGKGKMMICRQILEQDAYIRLKFGLNDPEIPEMFRHLDSILTGTRAGRTILHEQIFTLLHNVRRVLEERWRRLAD
ncbi:hypothetical protein [Falsirhodobacter halotolerans]|uniref:hypothetical protein n=1 Tax=Falsirhodobacter halotolerans TaxID=1146892 RepID=UPI001FD61A09|nr:hypothetical protein [Falsirhodobacter halotolerans]MCJ8139541.1 hypothetical protein [Falsirhodobacter halotolerans]